MTRLNALSLLSLSLILANIATPASAENPTCERKVDTYSSNGKTIDATTGWASVAKLEFSEKTTATFVPHTCGESAILEEPGLSGMWVITHSACSLAPLRIAFWSGDAEITNAKVWNSGVPVSLEMSDFNSRQKIELRCTSPTFEPKTFQYIEIRKPEMKDLLELKDQVRRDEKIERLLESLKNGHNGEQLLPAPWQKTGFIKSPQLNKLIRKLVDKDSADEITRRAFEYLRVWRILNPEQDEPFRGLETKYREIEEMGR
jgi:hypothetical protein